MWWLLWIVVAASLAFGAMCIRSREDMRKRLDDKTRECEAHDVRLRERWDKQVTRVAHECVAAEKERDALKAKLAAIAKKGIDVS